MSSSSPRAFLAVFAATAAMIGLVAAVVTLLVDPTGMLADLWRTKPQLCTPGIRTQARPIKIAVADRVRPVELLIGSSRVSIGFDAADAAGMLSGEVANLAISGPAFEELEPLVRKGVAGGRLRRVWLGLDFGMFLAPALTSPEMSQADRGYREDRLRWVLRQGLAKSDLARAALTAWIVPSSCARPIFDLAGFTVEHDAGRQPHGPARLAASASFQRTRFRKVVGTDPRELELLYRMRLKLLADLLGDLRHGDVRVVAYVGPVPTVYRSLIRETGLQAQYLRWRRDMQLVAANSGAVLLELNVVEPNSCAADSRPVSCPFYDVTHFRRHIGRQILEKGVIAAPIRH